MKNWESRVGVFVGVVKMWVKAWILCTHVVFSMISDGLHNQSSFIGDCCICVFGGFSRMKLREQEEQMDKIRRRR